MGTESVTAAAAGPEAEDREDGTARLDRTPSRLAMALFASGLGYACYRGYYALGGQAAMIGRPESESEFRQVNMVAVVILLGAAVLPLIAAANWRRPLIRRVLPGACWVAAAGCCMHALVDGTLRVLSLTGVHAVHYPPHVWASVNHQAADLQDLLGNEPWFLIEGCLWAALGLCLIRREYRRQWWQSAAAACALLTAVGLLSAFHVIGSVTVG